jgi:hypothetical protein
MRREREELRRGIRAFIQDASVELAEFTSTAAPALPKPSPASREPVPPDRPILRLVREAPQAPEAMRGVEELTLHPRKGVCAAYFVNKKCWELSEAFCNQALHVCRLRECPVYALHQDEMERRFASKFKHLW